MMLIPSVLQCAMAELCEMAVDHTGKHPQAGSRAGDPEYVKNVRELAIRWRSLQNGHTVLTAHPGQNL
ncbi:hypothetical protein N7376_22210 [Brucella intermedia GD04153]|uniref:Uncharacterized protein n=1 Tax=Brucella intermedia GD04153 TaxID=2975438 RepID=A0AA42H3Z6_9HYPH|nr:hypothetical protein [Brucella intermedia]MDH0126694.1 hypothetical protein [Brucella intermedia GD04153]